MKKEERKITLINPNNRNPLGELVAIEPPIWLSLMASDYLERGHDVAVIDAEAAGLTTEETLASIRAAGADQVILVVMGNNPSVSSTPKMTAALRVAKALAKDIPVYFTGLHPMAVPKETVYPMISWTPRKCWPIHWELLPMELYRAHNWHCLDGTARQPYGVTYTSLGCPFGCYYCNIGTLYGHRQVMFRSLDSIVKEIHTLAKRYEVRNIKVWDELFALREERVVAICDALKGYNLNMWAYARADTITEKMLRAMADVGITWLAYGFESASGTVRTQSHKTLDDEQIERAISMTRDAGINIIGNFMFGLPGETYQSAQDTLDFAKRHLFEFANFYVALPYPGSPWHRDLKASVRAEDYDQYGMPSSKFLMFRDHAFNDYFSNPLYLNMIERKFGLQGKQQIVDMLNHTLIRRFENAGGNGKTEKTLLSSAVNEAG